MKLLKHLIIYIAILVIYLVLLFGVLSGFQKGIKIVSLITEFIFVLFAIYIVRTIIKRENNVLFTIGMVIAVLEAIVLVLLSYFNVFMWIILR